MPKVLSLVSTLTVNGIIPSYTPNQRMSFSPKTVFGLVHICLRYACDGAGMPVFVPDIPAKLSSSQLSRPTADVTEVNWWKWAANAQIIMRHVAGIPRAYMWTRPYSVILLFQPFFESSLLGKLKTSVCQTRSRILGYCLQNSQYISSFQSIFKADDMHAWDSMTKIYLSMRCLHDPS